MKAPLYLLRSSYVSRRVTGSQWVYVYLKDGGCTVELDLAQEYAFKLDAYGRQVLDNGVKLLSLDWVAIPLLAGITRDEAVRRYESAKLKEELRCP